MIFSIILWILNALFCYKLAKTQNKNTTTALILGFLFGIFAVFGYIITMYKK